MAGHDLPTIPQYNMTSLNLREVETSDSVKIMEASASMLVQNPYPITFTVPPLGFRILVSGCSTQDEYLQLADAETDVLEIQPMTPVFVNVTGIVRRLTDSFTVACPRTHVSPLDSLLGKYIHGLDGKIFVQGADGAVGDTPEWISKLISNVIVPVPFPGHSFDALIRDFSLTDVHLGLPSPFAEPDTPDGSPKISATVQAIVNLPDEMNFPINISRVRALADVYYHQKKLGVLDLRKWHEAKSTRIEPRDGEKPGLAVSSAVKDAPLNITDEDVFSDVVQAMLFGGHSIVLGVKATVDVETTTVLGTFVAHDLPAEGKVPIKRQ